MEDIFLIIYLGNSMEFRISSVEYYPNYLSEEWIIRKNS